MYDDVEERLSRELGEVAAGLQVPPIPLLAQEQRRAVRRWQPLLVAAAFVLLIAGVTFGVAARDDGDVQPAPSPSPSPSPVPSPSATEEVGTIPDDGPRVPFVLDQQLHVEGAQVPGEWWSVRSGTVAWVGLRTDGTWWWGRGTDAMQIEGWDPDSAPVISPNGLYVAGMTTEDGQDFVTGFDTRASGEGLGGVSVDAGDRQLGTAVTVRAVTDEGMVIAQGAETALLWLPLVDQSTVDLTATAPDQEILGNSAGGLVVLDGSEELPYLGELAQDGELTRLPGEVPAHDDLIVSPGAEWLGWTPPGTTAGEVTSVSTLEVGTLSGARQFTLSAPDGWGFATRTWVWEDEQYLVARVLDEAGQERMTRCGVAQERCELVETP